MNVPSSPNLRPAFAASWKGIFLLELLDVNAQSAHHINHKLTANFSMSGQASHPAAGSTEGLHILERQVSQRRR
jgi:hypothetical protein